MFFGQPVSNSEVIRTVPKFMNHRPKRRATSASKTAKSLLPSAKARIINNLGYDPTQNKPKAHFGSTP